MSDFPVGVHYGMSFEAYVAVEALNASGMKLLLQSPAHFWHQVRDPARPVVEPSPQMKAGTLLHTVLFEPDEFPLRYAVKPPGMKLNTKAGMAWAERLPPEVEIITAEQLATAERQRDQLLTLEDVGDLLRVGEPGAGRAEVSVFWIDEATGVRCKCRVDLLAAAGDGWLIVDGKSTDDASAEGFGRAVERFSYHLQAEWYSQGVRAATGRPVHGFVFVVVEQDWPNLPAAYSLDEAAHIKARVRIAEATRLYARCMETNRWPGLPLQVQPLSLRPWAA